MNQEQQLERAKKRVREIKAFYEHFVVYVIVMIVLVLIDWRSGPGWWFYWPLFGWGIGITFHAVGTFGVFGLLGPDWEERKVRQLMAKQQDEDELP